MERYWLPVILSKSSIQIAVRKYQRQTRDAVNQAVQESSESYEVPMMQEILSVQNDMKDQWKKIKRESGTNGWMRSARNLTEAFRGQRNVMLQEHPVFIQALFFKSETHLVLHSHVGSYRRVLHEREVQQEHISQSFQNLENKQETPRRQDASNDSL